MSFSQDLVAVYTKKSTPSGHVKLKMLTPGAFDSLQQGI